jgi:predicted HAD superfamily Cof-like phosphohydrolase
MSKLLKLFPVFLAVHDAGAAAPGAAPAAQAGTQAQPAVGQQAKPGEAKPVVLYGKQPDGTAPAAGENPQQPTAKTPEQRRAEFEALIKGDFKDEFTERTNQIINRRFAETKTLEDQLKAYSPLTDTLAAMFGVDDKDPAKLLKAVQSDNKLFETLADAAGLSVEQYKDTLKLQIDKAAVKAQQEAIAAEQDRVRKNIEWRQQSEALKAKYPSFDLAAEITNEKTGVRFAGLLNSGVDIQSAFQAVHFDEIMSGAITAAGQKTADNITSTIQAKGQRPKESGAASTPGVIIKNDPSKLTAADRKDIAARVARGEKITW